MFSNCVRSLTVPLMTHIVTPVVSIVCLHCMIKKTVKNIFSFVSFCFCQKETSNAPYHKTKVKKCNTKKENKKRLQEQRTQWPFRILIMNLWEKDETEMGMLNTWPKISEELKLVLSVAIPQNRKTKSNNTKTDWDCCVGITTKLYLRKRRCVKHLTL